MNLFCYYLGVKKCALQVCVLEMNWHRENLATFFLSATIKCHVSEKSSDSHSLSSN